MNKIDIISKTRIVFCNTLTLVQRILLFKLAANVAIFFNQPKLFVPYLKGCIKTPIIQDI